MHRPKINELKEIILRIIRPVLILMCLIIIGTTGYSIIEGYNPLDSLYMTIISLTTVGYETPGVLSKVGKLFTCIYLLFSVVIFLYLGSEFAKHVIHLNLRDILTRRQMDSRINNLTKHFIICGFGRTGKYISSYLLAEDLDFLVVDNDLESIKDAQEHDKLTIQGDATNDDILCAAKIKDAKGLFACLSSDADNMFVTIAAKELNPNVDIVVRCNQATNVARFKRAGATNVISPYEICGLRMVSSVLRPLVADFLDEVMDTKVGLQLRMEQILLPERSKVCGKTIIESNIRPESGAYILAIKRGKEYIHNPTADKHLHSGDYLISLGTTDQLLKLESMVGNTDINK
ncbi:MAG: potassium channel protein [Cyanobacteriota bacterium]